MQESVNSTILHVDMDAFYASVSIRENPKLKGKPVVVGAGARGVVLSANYQAREYGIRAAMPVGRARRLAPNAVFVSPDHEKYSEVSDSVMAIFRKYTPYVEPLSLDEAFLDVTGVRKLFGSGNEIAQKIRAEVLATEKITCSVGIAHNKFIAKLASGHCKPDGWLEVKPEAMLQFLHPLPVSAIWGVGPATEEQLVRLGLRTVADIANTPLNTLIRALGDAAGNSLYELAWGRDFREVTIDEPDKSISAAETFSSDLEDSQEILRELLRLTEKATSRMRTRQLMANTISIKVRFADFKTISKSKTVDLPISGTQECYLVAKKLYESLKLDGARIRLVGISLENLIDQSDSVEQLTLGQRPVGWRQAEAAVDDVSEKFGQGAVRPARLIGD